MGVDRERGGLKPSTKGCGVESKHALVRSVNASSGKRPMLRWSPVEGLLIRQTDEWAL